MGKAPTRNTERTRRAVLDAAATLLAQKGSGVVLADVASAAGVSKSGLLHHFPSRDVLLLGVLEDLHSRLREAAHRNLDTTETRPGAMLRAYVRTLCGRERSVTDVLSALPFWAGLDGVPGADELDRLDQQWWRDQLFVDGIDPVLVRIIRRAAEGLAAARAYGDESDADVLAAGAELIRLTLRPEGGTAR